MAKNLAALRRIHGSGLTLAQCWTMGDSELLAFPLIGRKTLRFIRSFQWAAL